VLRIEQDIRRLGGIARRGELLRMGHSRDFIDMTVIYRRNVVCLRKGWYALKEAPADVLAAWRSGGRLACVSAARYYGLDLPDAGRLHVSVPRNASRLPAAAPTLVRHWSDNQTLEGRPSWARAAVPLAEALAQIRTCACAVDAIAVLAKRDVTLAVEARLPYGSANGSL
jgi:hypothetical protein